MSTPHGPHEDRHEHVQLPGTVTEVLPSGFFRVVMQGGHQVLAYLSGKLCRNRIRIVLGDRVTVEVSVYDPTRAASSTACPRRAGKIHRLRNNYVR